MHEERQFMWIIRRSRLLVHVLGLGIVVVVSQKTLVLETEIDGLKAETRLTL